MKRRAKDLTQRRRVRKEIEKKKVTTQPEIKLPTKHTKDTNEELSVDRKVP